MNTLQRAMQAAETQVDEEVGAAVASIEERYRHAVELEEAAEKRAKADEVEQQRQRDLDAALADAVEVVNRNRARLGRRICSRHDGETVRRVFELLRAMQAGQDQGGFE